MSRTLRGILARRASLLALAAMACVAVAGTLTVLGFADRAGTSWTLVIPLLLLSLIAVPHAGRELAETRRGEIAVARLRGLSGPELVRLLALEPVLAMLAGTVAGVALGTLGTWLATGRWLDDAQLPAWRTVVVAAAISAAGVIAVYAGMRRTVVEPLPAQIAAGTRPPAVTVWSAFGALLVLIGAAVALYRSGVSADDPDGLTLAGPALVGLAAGQVAVWAIAAVAALMIRRTATGSTPAYLAARRLRRTRDIATPIRLLVAAAVVSAVALAGASAVGSWADDTASLDTLGGRRVPVDGSVTKALTLTQRLDPEGRDLMAGVVVAEAGDLSGRRVFLDLGRYAAVVGDALDETPASGVAQHADALAEDTRGPVSGSRLQARVEGAAGDGQGPLLLTLTVLDDDGYLTDLQLTVPAPTASRPATAQTRVSGCARGCWPVELQVADQGINTGVLELTALTLGSDDVLARGWVDRDLPAAEPDPSGLTLRSTEAEFAPLGADAPIDVLETKGLQRTEGEPSITTPGGRTRPARVVGDLDALPLLGTVGQLADLGAANAGDTTTVPRGESFVVASEDAPAGLVSELERASGHEALTWEGSREQAMRSAGAEQAPVFVLMALSCVALALVVLLASAARQRRVQRIEIAALRVVGVPHRDIARAATVELAVQTVVAVVIAVLGSLLATAVLLVNLPILALPADALPLAAGVHPLSLLLAAALCALALVLVGRRSRALTAGQTAPSLLREEDR